MPVYEYSCDECEKDIEIIKSISECYGEERCTECGSILTKKIPTGGNFKLIGGGWADSRYQKWEN